LGDATASGFKQHFFERGNKVYEAAGFIEVLHFGFYQFSFLVIWIKGRTEHYDFDVSKALSRPDGLGTVVAIDARHINVDEGKIGQRHCFVKELEHAFGAVEQVANYLWIHFPDRVGEHFPVVGIVIYVKN
jgi:hypothetical protein